MVDRARKKVSVVCFTGNSGLTDYSVSLCRALSPRSNVTLLTGYNIQDRFTDFGFEVLRFFRKTRYYPMDLMRLFVRLVSERPDLVVFQSWLKAPLAEFVLVLLLRLVGIRTAVTVHDILPHYPKPWSKAELSLFYRAFNHVVAHSEDARRQLIKMGVSRPILVVPHGLYDLFDLEGVNKETARRWFPEISMHDFVVLFFGRITPRKGIINFLRLARLHAGDGGMKFVIAGYDGMKDASQGELDEYQSLIDGPNIILRNERIPFAEVQYYFAATDVVVLPYNEGTTSGVIKLALAFKKPVVATDVGDIASTLSLGFGEIVPLDGDIDLNLSEALTCLRSGYSGYKEKAELAGDDFSWDRIGDKYCEYLSI